MEGRKGEQPKKLEVYNTEERIKIDGELTELWHLARAGIPPMTGAGLQR